VVRLALLFLALLTGTVAAERLAEVIDGATLRLEDGRELRLAGIDPPRPPLAEAARAALRELAGGELVLRRLGQDRHGRILAQVRAGEAWLQGELVRRGLARVHTTLDTRAEAPALLRLEAAARQAGKGIWSRPEYQLRTPETVGRHLDSFQIVEGTIADAGRGRGNLFLNFGPDRKSDFTVRIPGTAARLFREAGLDPLSLRGERVRVRGWVRRWDGPLIDVTHPEQVERLP
jgi:endonuclease YncB( thermonuclease family)